jgi:hypothetical protein
LGFTRYTTRDATQFRNTSFVRWCAPHSLRCSTRAAHLQTLGGSSREPAIANVATMAKTRTVVFVMFSLAGSSRQTASRQMATVLNRLSSGGISEPDVHLVMPLGDAKGEPPMGEHCQRLGVIIATKHPMRRTKVSKSKSKLQARDSLQPRRLSLCTHSRLGPWSGGRVCP